MDIIMIGNAGASGTVKIAEKKYLELREKYPEWFIDQAKNIQQDQNDEVYKKVEDIVEKTVVMIKSNDETIPLTFKCGEGGIMNTLWELGKVRKKGFVIDIFSIPIKQETVEISEFYHLDPYRLESFGAYIAVVRSGAESMALLKKVGMEACIIGYLNNSKDKILLFDTDGEVRFLDRPREDELAKVK